MQAMISFYPKISETKRSKDMPLDMFLDNIRDGVWQDVVLPIRTMTDEQRQAAKKRVPYVTLSGTFRERADSALIVHSGYIGMDIDDVDPEEVKSILGPDPHVYAIFTSIGGRGVCVIFKINGDKHREAYSSISESLFQNYQLITDPTGINPSRARFVSYDPHIYVNTAARKFTAVEKRKAERKVQEVIYVQNDFEAILQEIIARNLDITGDYHQWLRIGFAFADKFGESGRTYFHQVSRPSAQYEPKTCDRQFTNCLKARGSKTATISSFYYYAKQAGISTVSPKTKLISQAAHFAKRGGRTRESAITYLKDAEGIPEDESEPVVEQVFASNISLPADDTVIEQTRDWLRMEYDIRRNEVTRKIEINGQDMDETVFNDVFCACKIVIDKINAELLKRIINSNYIPTYNPFKIFFEKYASRQPKGVIKEFFGTVQTDTGMRGDEFCPDYLYHFGTRWLVGIISSIHGQHSPLMLVFSGPQGNGKTEFFRRLLPAAFQPYFAESKMDNPSNKDEIMLLVKKLIIFNDEMSGKNKKEEKQLKEMLSKQGITVRPVWDTFDIDLKRLAVFCGTTNEQDILNDPTGNRRIIPVHVLSIDYEKINTIDRIDLFMEAYWLWKDGLRWELSSQDVATLNNNTGFFEHPSPEYDLLTRYYELAEEERIKKHIAALPHSTDLDIRFLTTTETKAALEMRSQQKLNINKLGLELKKIGAERINRKIKGLSIKGYWLVEKLPNQGWTVDK